MRAIGMRVVLLFTALAAMTTCGYAFVSDKSSDCVEMVEKAEAFLQEKGKDYALRVFSASKGPFVDRDLYVFVCSMDNKLLAHPFRRDLVGQDVNQLKDAEGNPIFQEFQKIAAERGSGWVSYSWKKPGEEGLFAKMTYIKRISDYNMYVGVGYYKGEQRTSGFSRADSN